MHLTLEFFALHYVFGFGNWKFGNYQSFSQCIQAVHSVIVDADQNIGYNFYCLGV